MNTKLSDIETTALLALAKLPHLHVINLEKLIIQDDSLRGNGRFRVAFFLPFLDRSHLK